MNITGILTGITVLAGSAWLLYLTYYCHVTYPRLVKYYGRAKDDLPLAFEGYQFYEVRNGLVETLPLWKVQIEQFVGFPATINLCLLIVCALGLFAIYGFISLVLTVPVLLFILATAYSYTVIRSTTNRIDITTNLLYTIRDVLEEKEKNSTSVLTEDGQNSFDYVVGILKQHNFWFWAQGKRERPQA